MAATPCSGPPLSEKDLVTTYDSAVDYIMTIDTSQPFGQKTKRIKYEDIFSGWTNGDMILQNNTNSATINIRATNSSSIVKLICAINADIPAVSLPAFLRFAISSQDISSGTITADRSYIEIDTESGAASDDLDTINNGTQGNRLILCIANSSRTVTVKHMTGNIKLEGNVDFAISNIYQRVELFYQNGYWIGRGINVT